MLTVKDLSVTYFYGAAAIRNLTLECDKARPACVYAQVEGGKTSLVKCVAGLIPKSGGEILFDGVSDKDLKIKDRNVSVLYEDFSFFRFRSVKRNLAYVLKNWRLGTEKLEFVIRKFKLDAILKKPFRKLSEKDKVRVAFARLFLREANVYLLDNPFAHIFKVERAAVFKEYLPYIKELSEKAALIFTTDDLDEAISVSDNITFLNFGIVLCQGNGELIKAKLEEAIKEQLLYFDFKVKSKK